MAAASTSSSYSDLDTGPGFMGLEIPRDMIHLVKEIGISEKGTRKGRWSKVFFGMSSSEPV